LSDRAAEAFRSLQARARAEHAGNTQPLLVVYAVESFLRRLALSDYAERMVLKGGMLMAASGVRRMTQDADLSTHGVTNDAERVREIVAEICSLVPDPHDGVVIDPATIRTEVMREGDEYQGVRCKLVAGLGRARIPFALDISFGDPGTSTTIELASLIDQPDVRLRAYPLALNLAEKIVTAMQRRETSTRDRDFADLWVCSRRFDFEVAELLGHIRDVAEHRGQAVTPLAEALANMPDRQQPYAAMVRRMSYLAAPPKRWTHLVADVIAFVDPLLDGDDGALSRWSCDGASWR
jgi:predicted nucleotidyltransferase component of viral defense system